MHYYKFNVASWAKDTSHLSLKEEAIYLRLVNFYYDHEKPIPLKTHLVLRKLRMADESETVELILEEFFNKTKDGWTHKHCEKLIGEYQKMAERNKKNAKLGGRPKIKDLENPTGNQDGTEDNPTGIPNYKPETNNQEPETNKQKKPSKAKPSDAKEVQDYFSERGYAELGIGQKFIDHYESIGWKRGKQPVKDWKATARTWMTKMKPTQKPMQHKPENYDPLESLRNM